MNTYHVPMHRLVSLIFMIAVALVAGVVVWCFRSGFLWSGLCTIAVAGPLTLMYWYMLLVNPARAAIGVSDEGITISAAPFTEVALPLGEIRRVFEANMKDENLAISKLKRAMRFGKYKSGTFILKSEQTAVVLTNSNQVLGLEVGETLYLLGPSDFKSFAADVQSHTS